MSPPPYWFAQEDGGPAEEAKAPEPEVVLPVDEAMKPNRGTMKKGMEGVFSVFETFHFETFSL